MITANFATYRQRAQQVDRAVRSIMGQVDLVRVHYNDYTPNSRSWEQHVGPDLTDRGKLAHIGAEEIAFTCDDDIIYPEDYVEVTLQKLREHGGIVTYHGRRLLGKGLDYYADHEAHHCLFQRGGEERIDVPGSGVMCFRSEDFQPHILSYEQDCMADVLVGLEAARQGVKVTCAKHRAGWLRLMKTSETIYRNHRQDTSEQERLCDKIWELRRGCY